MVVNGGGSGYGKKDDMAVDKGNLNPINLGNISGENHPKNHGKNHGSTTGANQIMTPALVESIQASDDVAVLNIVDPKRKRIEEQSGLNLGRPNNGDNILSSKSKSTTAVGHAQQARRDQ